MSGFDEPTPPSVYPSCHGFAAAAASEHAARSSLAEALEANNTRLSSIRGSSSTRQISMQSPIEAHEESPLSQQLAWLGRQEDALLTDSDEETPPDASTPGLAELLERAGIGDLTSLHVADRWCHQNGMLELPQIVLLGMEEQLADQLQIRPGPRMRLLEELRWTLAPPSETPVAMSETLPMGLPVETFSFGDTHGDTTVV